MDLPLYAKLFLGQAAAALIVIVILKSILDKNLINAAIRRLELWDSSDSPEPVRQIIVISHKKLSSIRKERILKAVKQHFGDSLKTDFRVDRGIYGGMIIQVGKRLINNSVKDRLRQAYP